jgi:hypothetical protein
MTDQTYTPKSPLEVLTVDRFKRRTYINETVVNVAANRVTILPNNPNRLFLAMINEGILDVRVSTDPAITPASGWLLPAGGGFMSMFWEEDGESVGYALYGIGFAGGSDVRVREVLVE